MKPNISSIILIFFLSINSFADVIDDDIATAKDIDELVQKMTQANHTNRYRYMNAIKNQIASLKEEKRVAKLENIMSNVQSSKTEQQEALGHSYNSNQNRKNSTNGIGGNSGSGNGNGGGNGGGRN